MIDSPPPGVPRRPKSATFAGEVLDRAKERPILTSLATAAVPLCIALFAAVQAQCNSWAAQKDAATAAARATIAQEGQDKADLGSEITYRALADLVKEQGAAVEELTDTAKKLAKRVEDLEAAVAAGRRPRALGEAPVPDVDVEAVTADLPSSPAAAAAAATATPARRNP